MKRKIGIAVMLLGASFLTAVTAYANSSNITSSVVVGNAPPTVSGVSVNGGGAITLVVSSTQTVNVLATVNDNNGCADLTGGTTTILLYRTGVSSSSCLAGTGGAATNLNCYKATAFTASSTCTGSSTSVNTTTTFSMYYFAQATDASSSYPTDSWRATVIFKDPSNATGSNDSSGVSVGTITGISVTTSSINYGTLAPNSTSSVSTTTIVNVGNSSTSLQLSASATLTSSGNVIATSSQHYATSSFTYGGSEGQLSGTAATVSGFTLTAPTSTTSVAGSIYWALQVPAGSVSGTYSGTNVFGSLFTQ